MPTRLPVIAIVGGTGALGSALARRFAAAGYQVVIGSRSPEKAHALSVAIGDGKRSSAVRGANNVSAVRAADIAVIAVPFASHDAILEEIADAVAGKIVVDAVVPLVPPRIAVAQPPARGSAGQIAHDRLGARARVVAAFHNVAAAKLAGDEAVDCDVMVFGDNHGARDVVIRLADAIGARGIDGGPIANAIVGEALTSVLIGINRKYKVVGAGIRITGLADARVHP